MWVSCNMKTIVYSLGVLAVFLLSGSGGQEVEEVEVDIEQELGTGVDGERDIMDTCTGAAGPRPANGIFSPGRTNYATVDDVNGGYCGVNITNPGIWWLVEGTGGIIRASSCHIETDIKVKISVFTGESCDSLTCVTGSDEPDFECPILRRENKLGEWDTMATALNFPTVLGQNYYILVQQQDDQRGTVWINFRTPTVPQNDNCIDAIGPVPRNMIRIPSTSVDASLSYVPQGYCGGDGVPALYPGTWFQVMGTGGSLTVMACGEFNFDGYAFSVYNGGGQCDSLDCVSGGYDLNVADDKCDFGPREFARPMTKYTFKTIDRSRYYIYVHTARTRAVNVTGDFRFFVDDGKNGEGGTSGSHMMQFEEPKGISNSDLFGNGDFSNTNGGKKDGDNGNEKSTSTMIRSSGLCFYGFLIASSWMVMIR